MNASGKRIDGYDTAERRLRATVAKKVRWSAKKKVGEAKVREALEAMFATIHELLEAQRLAYAGNKDFKEHAAAMRKLLRYVKQKMKDTTKKPDLNQRPYCPKKNHS